MTDENQSTHTPEDKPLPFGARLKSTRETLGLERKEAASQLRLNEKFIIMMEKDRYPADLPVTFIRGYLRAYGKLLDIPEHEIKKGIEPIKSKPVPLNTVSTPALQLPVTSSNYFVQIVTYLIVLTIVILMGMWWYSHTTTTTNSVTDNSIISNHEAMTPPPVINIPAASPPSKNATQSPQNKVPLAAPKKIVPQATSTAATDDVGDTTDESDDAADTDVADPDNSGNQ